MCLISTPTLASMGCGDKLYVCTLPDTSSCVTKVQRYLEVGKVSYRHTVASSILVEVSAKNGQDYGITKSFKWSSSRRTSSIYAILIFMNNIDWDVWMFRTSAIAFHFCATEVSLYHLKSTRQQS